MKNLFIIIFISTFFISKEFKDVFFNDYTKNMIKKIIKNTYNESNICESNIYSSFQEETSLNYLINSSSLDGNDISSYYSCKEGEITNYYIITFKPINSTENRIQGTYDINYNLYGICIYNNSLNCSNKDIKDYLKKIANKTEISNGKTVKIRELYRTSEIKIGNIHLFMLFFFLDF